MRKRKTENMSNFGRIGGGCKRVVVVEKKVFEKLEADVVKMLEREKQTEKTAEEGDNPCGVCFQNEKILAPSDCGHLILCAACALKIFKGSRQCPLCCGKISDFVRVFANFETVKRVPTFSDQVEGASEKPRRSFFSQTLNSVRQFFGKAPVEPSAPDEDEQSSTRSEPSAPNQEIEGEGFTSTTPSSGNSS